MEKFITAVKSVAAESNIVALIFVLAGVALYFIPQKEAGASLITLGAGIFQHKTQQ